MMVMSSVQKKVFVDKANNSATVSCYVINVCVQSQNNHDYDFNVCDEVYIQYKKQSASVI